MTRTAQTDMFPPPTPRLPDRDWLAGDLRGLSLRQPWCDAILNGGKRVENRVKWKNCHYRGHVLLHAAKGMTKREYEEICEWANDAMLDGDIDWTPPPPDKLVFGGFVGRARIVGVVTTNVTNHPEFDVQHLPSGWWKKQKPWWMRSFALVLDEVQPLPKFIPYAGALGLFRIPESIREQLRAA